MARSIQVPQATETRIEMVVTKGADTSRVQHLCPPGGQPVLGALALKYQV